MQDKIRRDQLLRPFEKRRPSFERLADVCGIHPTQTGLVNIQAYEVGPLKSIPVRGFCES